MQRYVELHLHTPFSFLDGASSAEELVNRAVELGYHALAVTDHDGLYGAMEFAQTAQAAGIAPITGAELTLLDGSHLTLLASTKQGYANLSQLITEAHRLPNEAVSRQLSATSNENGRRQTETAVGAVREPPSLLAERPLTPQPPSPRPQGKGGTPRSRLPPPARGEGDERRRRLPSPDAGEEGRR